MCDLISRYLPGTVAEIVQASGLTHAEVAQAVRGLPYDVGTHSTTRRYRAPGTAPIPATARPLPSVEAVARRLLAQGPALTARIANETGKEQSSVMLTLLRLEREGLIARAGKGRDGVMWRLAVRS
jgi:DNA-binding transcriptional ArsR family regulator